MNNLPYVNLNGEIGREIARLIRAGTKDFAPKLCQFGGVAAIAELPSIAQMLPAVFVEPDSPSLFEETDIAGTLCTVTEDYRIVVFAEQAPDAAPYSAVEAASNAVLAALAGSPALAFVGTSIKPHQISRSYLTAIDWHPDEQLFLTESNAAVKVVTLAWNVRWYCRN